jgi:aspartyl-tRNA(Asn)/glutamyl-tRNA(Gln) amidotransferase subunit B
MRSKEEANDYRYFPDPDLLPVVVEEHEIAAIRAALPELPEAKRRRFIEDYGLSAYDADVLTSMRALGDYYDAVAAMTKSTPKLAANWIMGELTAALNREHLEIGASKIAPAELAALLDKIHDGTISGKIAKEIFEALWRGEGAVEEIIDQRGLRQISDSASIEALVADVLAANPEQVEQFRAGKTQVLGFLVGQVMKASQGKANPQQVNAVLRAALEA